MKGEQDGWTERGERGKKGRQQNARRRWVEGGGESHLSSINNTRCTAPALHYGLGRLIARRLTEERWRKRGEGRKNGRQKVKAIDGGSNRARGLCVRATERWRRGACERQKGGKIERDG